MSSKSLILALLSLTTLKMRIIKSSSMVPKVTGTTALLMFPNMAVLMTSPLTWLTKSTALKMMVSQIHKVKENLSQERLKKIMFLTSTQMRTSKITVFNIHIFISLFHILIQTHSNLRFKSSLSLYLQEMITKMHLMINCWVLIGVPFQTRTWKALVTANQWGSVILKVTQ
jgi:hypothetical protein